VTGTPYALDGFNAAFGQWVETERPDRELQLVVFDWIYTRYDDPYQGVRREPGFENLWFGAIPNTSRGDTAVQCAYFIAEAQRLVKCDSFATLGLPI
jgi:hypothetical protein